MESILPERIKKIQSNRTLYSITLYFDINKIKTFFERSSIINQLNKI